jgi:hypothetical protein
MSEMNEVYLRSNGDCFRLFVKAFNARQALYVSKDPESKNEVQGEVLLSTILEQYTETVCNAVTLALFKMKGNVKKMLKVTYEESKISFRRNRFHTYFVGFQYGLPLNTTKIPESVWLLMNLDLMVPEGQQTVNTLPINQQTFLIKDTVSFQTEEKIMNDSLLQYSQFTIVIYGKNCSDKTIEDKYRQLRNLGYLMTNLYIYYGGLFEWSMLQDIYGFENFPTTSKNDDILLFKPQSVFQTLHSKPC